MSCCRVAGNRHTVTPFRFPSRFTLPALLLHPQRMNEPVGEPLRQHGVASVHALCGHEGERQFAGIERATFGQRLANRSPKALRA